MTPLKRIINSYLIYTLLTPLVSLAENITLVADEWCPYSCANEHYREGIGVDIARMIFEKAGYDVTYKTTTWLDAINRVEQGDADVLIGVIKTEVPEMLFPGYHFSYSNTCFISRPEVASNYSTLMSIEKGPIGIIEGYDYEQPLDDYLKKAPKDKVVKYQEVDDLFAALMRKEIDVFIEDDKVATYYSGKNNHILGKDYSIASCHLKGGVYFAVAPNNSDKTFTLLSLLDKGLYQALRDGTLNRIHKKYGFDIH